MQINWKKRFRNKTFIISLISAIVVFAYQVARLFGIVIPFTEADVMNIVTLAITPLTFLGIIVDPTTPGTSDSDYAMKNE